MKSLLEFIIMNYFIDDFHFFFRNDIPTLTELLINFFWSDRAENLDLFCSRVSSYTYLRKTIYQEFVQKVCTGCFKNCVQIFYLRVPANKLCKINFFPFSVICNYFEKSGFIVFLFPFFYGLEVKIELKYNYSLIRIHFLGLRVFISESREFHYVLMCRFWIQTFEVFPTITYL